MTLSGKEKYEERLKRYVTACYNGKPDRIPIRIFAEEVAAKYSGYDNFEAAVDHELQFDVNRKFAVELNCDAIQTNSIVNWMGMMKALGWKGIVFPGIGLPVQSCTQWTEPGDEENAFLRFDEYDRFADDPTAFLLSTWLPRFTEHIQPSGAPVTFEHNMSLINGILAYDMFFSAWSAKTKELMDAGVVPAVSSVLKAPLDIIGDKLRGYINLVYDLHDRRDKVIAACEALMPHLYHLVLSGADPDRNIPSIIWMHRGSVPYITPSDFSEIYWPTLKPIIEELWANGQQIILYAEGNWEAHLEAFAQLPEKSVIFHADKTDIFKAHKILGSKFCISGGIPNELLTIGDPEDVRSYCKRIIDGVARDGGYIMDAGALILDDAKVENVKTMIGYTLEYGVYDPSQGESMALDEIKSCRRPQAGQYSFRKQRRRPGVCVPWDLKKKELPPITGKEELVKDTWEMIDKMGYLFLWVNLTW
jgi:hypothetical protein